MRVFANKPALVFLALVMLMSNACTASFDYNNGNIYTTGYKYSAVNSRSVNGIEQYISWNGEEIVKPVEGYPSHFTDKDLMEKNGKYYLRTGNYATPAKPIAAPLAQATHEAEKSPGMTFGLSLVAIGSFLISRKRS